MALLEQDVVVTTKHGRVPAFAACPDAPGAFPGIISYMDALGFREELCNMARRIAKHGYFCLLPDMYYRLGTVRFDLPRRRYAGRIAAAFRIARLRRRHYTSSHPLLPSAARHQALRAPA